MKRIRLTKEEKRIEDALMRGEYIKAPKKLEDEISKSLITHKKDYVMTIRVNSRDIAKIKRKAARLGVGYQTFISEVIHRVAAQ
jgi:predicted DNA binding CopG/RHH family protein